jgi:hypothetical protein
VCSSDLRLCMPVLLPDIPNPVPLTAYNAVKGNPTM